MITMMVNIANILLFFTNYLCVKYSIVYYILYSSFFYIVINITFRLCHCWSEPKYQQEEDAVPNHVVRVAGAK